MGKLQLTDLFASFDRTAKARFRALRQTARERLADHPAPSPRTEDWRFTDVTPLIETPFELANPDLTVDLALLPPRLGNAMQLLFLNGRWLQGLSTVPKVPPNVEIGSIADMIVGPLTRVADSEDGFFTVLNTSFLNDGARVIVPDGVALEQPIEIVYVSQAARPHSVSHPRTLVVVGKNAQATVIERYIGTGDYFTNAVTEIALGDGAVVDHVKLQQESATARHIANTQVAMAAKSNFTTHYLSLGGALVRNEVRVRFDGEHAEATVNGLYLAAGKQHIDNFTVIDHAQPNCASHELYKGILNDRSHGVFNGKIFVRKDAQKTDAKQTNKVLLLSDDATINTKPQLEIFADDVKCTHGATIGQLDATQLFYLQSRGIPVDQARRLLTFAFANDIVNRVKVEAIRDELEARIVR